MTVDGSGPLSRVRKLAAASGFGSYDAGDLLALISGWFSEGFETANLEEAKTLLEALSEKAAE